jgi:hypothetical protein
MDMGELAHFYTLSNQLERITARYWQVSEKPPTTGFLDVSDDLASCSLFDDGAKPRVEDWVGEGRRDCKS